MGVASKYKEELAVDDAAALKNYVGKLQETQRTTLVTVLKSYITAQLVEETTATTASLAGTLGWMEDGDNYLSDYSWFKVFPESIPITGSVSAFHLLVELS